MFAGGGARGAYEIGVCRYVFERVASDLGRPLPIDVVSGTSVGALHASALAVWADDPRSGMKHIAERWAALSLDDVISVDRGRTLNMIRALLGRPPRNPTLEAARGGMLDARPLEALLSSAVDFRRIDRHIASGRLAGVALTATHVGSGRTTVFYQSGAEVPPPRTGSRTRMQPVTLEARHAMASASIPFLFPAVRIEGALYCDGSLRQHVPLSPARHLGADALVVVNPRTIPPTAMDDVAEQHERAYPGPLFLLGKALNALTLDRVDGDIDQLERVNRVLAAGTRRYGPGFVAEINRTLVEDGGPPVKPIALLHLHASADIGRLAAAFVQSRRFQRRRGGLLQRAFARLAEGEGKTEADLLSYLLFDNRFTSELMELGWRDAGRRHDEIARFFAGLLDGREREPARVAAARR